MRTAKGTQNFAAPEIRLSSQAEYTNAVDVWGSGMITLLTLVGMANMDFAAILRYSAGAVVYSLMPPPHHDNPMNPKESHELVNPRLQARQLLS